MDLPFTRDQFFDVLAAYNRSRWLFALAPGHAFPRGPTFGVPYPTTLLTIGWLFAADPPWPKVLALIPIGWAVVGGSAAVLFGVRADLMLWAAGIALTASVLAHVHQQSGRLSVPPQLPPQPLF